MGEQFLRQSLEEFQCVLKDKLRHTKTFKSLFEQNWFESGNIQTNRYKGALRSYTKLITFMSFEKGVGTRKLSSGTEEVSYCKVS